MISQLFFVIRWRWVRVALIGFFKTKTKGFGRFSTSVFLILLVVVIAALLYAGGKLEGQVMANVLFAVFGFAGGLFTSKDGSEANTQ